MDNNKNKLKERFDEVKQQLLLNSKDAHWAKNAIDELVSLKGQLDHEPTLVYLPIKDVKNTLKGDTYEMNVMKDGTAVYHTYGGYTVVAKPNLTSLAGTIEEYIARQTFIDEFTDDEKKNLELDLSAFTYIMTLPTFAFSDLAFKYDIAGSIVSFLREKYDTLLNEGLAEETPDAVDANEKFKSATESLQKFKEG